MRILLIGDTSIQNDALKEIFTSKTGNEVEQVSHGELRDDISVDESYHVSLVDLISSPYKPETYIKNISRKKPSKHLIALHDYYSPELADMVIEAGADYCFSIDSETEDLEYLVSRLDDK